jgi:hypothetical protein
VSASPKILNCRHGWRLEGASTPCPFCNPEAIRALQGESANPEQSAATARAHTSNASLGIQKPSRTLDLAGKTVAGCAVDRMAADATANSRFHCVMSCGHPQIVDGTMLMSAARAGQVLCCKPCSKANGKALREAKRLAKLEKGNAR